jgi:hypothetical protein
MRRRTALLCLLAALALVAGTILSVVGGTGEAHASSSQNFLVTLYGWPDNSPPGNDIAYPVIHDGAGGTGTYGDPITFATDQDELAPGTIVYYSYLHRYFIMEDDCVECDQDWNNGKYHIDLWVGGEGGDPDAVINCEDDLTQDSAEAEINPPSDEQVDTTPLFDSSSNTCYDPGSFDPRHSVHSTTSTP